MATSPDFMRRDTTSGPAQNVDSSSAFTGQCIDHPALSRLGQQTQRTVQIGFTAAIGAGDQIEPRQRDDQLVDRAIVDTARW